MNRILSLFMAILLLCGSLRAEQPGGRGSAAGAYIVLAGQLLSEAGII